MDMISVYLFITVALTPLAVVTAEYEWSGFVNNIKDDFDYNCEESLSISGMASVFDDAQDDRRWEYQCSSGGGVANVTSTCTLQEPVNNYQTFFEFDCPSGGYISGMKSTYSDSLNDREWQPYCCTRPYTSLVNCHIQTSGWDNNVETLLNWTATDGRILTGMQSFYSAFNRDRRWRLKQCTLEVSCGDPGVPSNAVRVGDSFLYQDEVLFTCNHGYYQSSGAAGGRRECLDTGLWSDTQPVCSLCTDIDNCADIRCTNPTNQYCVECDSDQGYGLGERGFVNLNTSCSPLCSWLQSFCYPGECPGDYLSCNCSEGFAGLDCLTITDEPDLNSCDVTITSPDSVTSKCEINSTQLIYIDFIPTQVSVNFDTSFVFDDPPPKPAYVKNYMIGISTVDVTTSVYRMNSYPSSAASNTSSQCISSNPSPDNPLMMVDCVNTESDIAVHTFLHGDWFEVGVSISNGGHLNITDLDSNKTSANYYSGTKVFPYSLFIIDLLPPTHCSVEKSLMCLTDQVILSESLVFKNRLQLTWGGWSDSPSQVKSYEVAVFKLIYDSSTDVLNTTLSPVYSMSYDSEEGNQLYNDSSHHLMDEGPYSVILTISDTAGNKQYARKIILYDDDSELLEDTTIPLVIASGVAETDINAYWQNSTSDPIIVSGRGHFYNQNLKTDNWLAPVVPHSPAVLPVYDDDDRFGVNNSLGITSLHYQYIIDQEAGQSVAALTQPTSFPYQTQDLALDSVEVTPVDIVDGDSVTIWFEAIDFKNNDPLYESVLVHIDSSPPLIENLGLVKQGVDHLVYLYGSEGLVDLDISFESKDIHSGIDAIHWTLKTDLNVVGEGDMPVSEYNKDQCVHDCVCDIVDHCQSTKHSINILSTDFHHDDYSNALHDTDYYLTISVTNHAQLVASLTGRFTVDLTRPLSGKVYEKNLNKLTLQDIDYQSDMTFTVEWSEFFDRETAIIAYQYIVDTQCSPASAFEYPNKGNSTAISTSNTSIQWTASDQGSTYYTTVVAYNGAYLASEPVCSDGITIDNDPPLFTEVHIPEGKVHEGVVTSETGEVWVIHRNRERSKVNSPGLTCVNNSLEMSEEELRAFPIRYTSSYNVTLVPSHDCLNYPTFNPHTYTPVDTVYNISWSTTDNIGIRDYQFGVASNKNHSLTTPDLIPFTSTAGFAHFSVYHKLFRNSFELYFTVKAIDLAMHESITVSGPIVVDRYPPMLNGTIVSKQIDDLMIVTWEEWSIIDEEDIFPLTYQYSIGRTQFSDNIYPLSPLPHGPTHPDCLSGQCLVLNTTDLGFLRGNSYHVTMSVENTAGLFLYVPVDPVTMPFTLDSNCLSVFEYSSETTNVVSNSKSYFSGQYDHDTILEGDNITVSWYGLTENHYNVSFYVGVGTKPGQSDVVPFMVVGNGSYVELPEFQYELTHMYYSTVMAMNSHSVVYQSSDGFRIIPDLADDEAGVWNGLSDHGNRLHQLSSTEVSAHWYFPPSVTQLVSHYEWALYEYSNLTRPVLDYESVGSSQWGIRLAGLKTDVGYVTSVRACFKSFCLDDVYSDQFWLASKLDSTDFTILDAAYTPDIIDSYGYSSSGQLHITWTSNDKDIVKYQWTVGTSPHSGTEVISDWSTTTHQTVHITYSALVNLHKHHYVTVRGFNAAGSGISQTVDLVFTGDYTINDVVVFDVSADFVPVETDPVEFTLTEYNELDYTSTGSSLSAVWPQLRYSVYNYSLSTDSQFQSCDTADSAVISCGSTHHNGVTVSNLNLTHGSTYYFCVRAQADNAFTPYPIGPKTIKACSNGIMAYLTPPTGTCVQIVPFYNRDNLPTLTPYELLTNEEYIESPQSCVYKPGSQSTTDSVRIVWNQFTDTVVNDDFPHKSRTAYYEYAIGSTPGATDVVQYTGVGAVTSVYVTGLNLQHGITYYATIRATDLAGTQSVFTSLGITIDLTPPTFSNIWINSESAISVNTLEDLTMHWGAVTDTQSGVSGLYWSLGSEEGLSDLYKWTEVDITASGATIHDPLFHVTDGQPIILNMEAINSAGISSIRSSSLIVFDSTKPCSGRVFNGPKPYSTFTDIDYTSEHSLLSVHWEPFTDPHTSITEYKLAVGSCVGCVDVSPYISTGLLTDIRRQMSLKQGHTYYVSVEGCSEYSGCITSLSDSFTVDVTGPVTRRLINGLSQSVVQNFQASRYTISAHWSGIHDSESFITHYSYYIGTSPGHDDIVSTRTIPPSAQHILKSAPFDNGMTELPVNQSIHITLEVYNGVGVVNTVTSSGIVVSDQSPVVRKVPYIDYTWSGSVINDTQYANSAVMVRWNITDHDLSVDKYFWQVMFEDYTYQLVQPQLSYHGSHQTLLQLDLPDGAVLSAVLIACNQAGICVHTQTQFMVTIDSSPPQDGYFAVETDSTAKLPWAVSDGMTITDNNVSSMINLTFTGFTDSESDITEYWATIGSGYMNYDLYTSNESLSVNPSTMDVLSSLITLNRIISNGEKVYISLWAVNGVGISSRIVQGTFEVVISVNNTNGRLKLLRSQVCPIESCEGHCTCGEVGSVCDSTSSCDDRSHADLSDSEKATIMNVVSQGPGVDHVYTAVSDKLVASIELPLSYQFAEWSVGEKGKAAGSGVVDISSDPVWFPLVSQHMLIFDVSDSHPLMLGKTYVFYVRVWYNASQYAIFESNGVTFDNESPMVNKGYRVKEVEALSLNQDIDFIGSTSELFVKWSNVYDKRYATLFDAKYELCVGLSPGTDEALPCTEVKNATNYYSLTELSLTDNTQYYTVLRVTTGLGVVYTSISDGFTVDLSPPDIGAVFDGRYYSDESAHTTSSTSSVHVLGFNDPHSGVKSFRTNIGFSNGEGQLSYTDNEIARVIEIHHMELQEGNASFVSVIASNAAGVASSSVISSGSVYDTSPPVIHECTSTHVSVPTSFDTNGDHCHCLTDMGGWSLSGEYTVLYTEELLNWYKTVPVDNCCVLELMSGSSLSRDFKTTSGTQYMLSFWVLVNPQMLTEVLVESHGSTGDIELSKKTILRPTCDHRNGQVHRWQKLEYILTAVSSVSIISITTPTYTSILIDNIQLQYCSILTPTDDTTFTIPHTTRPDTITWPIYDTQSGVQEYMYAIGTVRGGIQISDYQSVDNNWGFHGLWDTVDTSVIHFSVKATNRAGLSAIYHSEPITIDKTAPVVSSDGIKEVIEIGSDDLDYTNSHYILLDWSNVVDGESGIRHCVWALGSSPGLVDIKNYTVSEGSHVNLTSDYYPSDNTTVYTTVICLNGAGLAVSAISDGIKFINLPPSHELADITVYNPSLTQCSPMDGYISTTSIQVVWDGFTEETHAPLYYQMKIVEYGQPLESVQWNDIGSLKQVTVNNLTVFERDLEHVVMVRAYSVEGLYSEPKSQKFVLVSSEPTIHDSIALNVTQMNGSLYVQWQNVFTTVAGPIYYEVTIGDQLGGGSIRKFITSEYDFIQVDESVIKESSTYFISIKAINNAGLSSHVNYMINGEMAFKL